MKPVYFAKYLGVNFENKMLSLTSVNDAQRCNRASSAGPTLKPGHALVVNLQVNFPVLFNALDFPVASVH